MEVVASAMPFHPVVDGDVIPAPPIDRIVAGAGADVDVLVGTNADDWRFAPVLGGFIDQITERGARPDRSRSTASGASRPSGCGAEAALPALPGRPLRRRRRATYWPPCMTDWWVRVPAMRLADAHATGPGGTFMYEFAWPSPAFGGRLGACHALEIPFVFDTLDLRRQMMGGALGEHPPQELADAMHRAWVDFAADGDPGWPRYDLGRRPVMRFGAKSSVVDDPYARERGRCGPDCADPGAIPHPGLAALRG